MRRVLLLLVTLTLAVSACGHRSSAAKIDTSKDAETKARFSSLSSIRLPETAQGLVLTENANGTSFDALTFVVDSAETHHFENTLHLRRTTRGTNPFLGDDKNVPVGIATSLDWKFSSNIQQSAGYDGTVDSGTLTYYADAFSKQQSRVFMVVPHRGVPGVPSLPQRAAESNHSPTHS